MTSRIDYFRVSPKAVQAMMQLLAPIVIHLLMREPSGVGGEPCYPMIVQ